MCELMQKLARQEAEQAVHDNRIKIAENSINEGVSISVTAKITNLLELLAHFLASFTVFIKFFEFL